MALLDQPLVFVDIETNGLSYTRGRVIEVAAIRVEGNKIFSSFNRLIDPETYVPEFITGLTGITNADVKTAPTFITVAEELYGILDGAIFVAHNARFDYSFLKAEFKRSGRQFSPKILCTVKLSRALYPTLRGHKLQDLIDRCDIKVQNRHRAYDDAQALYSFLEHATANFSTEELERAVARQIKAPSLPKGLSPALVGALPEATGVYIFQDKAGYPLYVGKSVNIKKRVMSHFSQDLNFESEFKISQGVANIECHQTAGELEALLLESRLVKEMQPLYNRQLRRAAKLTLARRHIDNQGFMTIRIDDTDQISPDQLDDILSVYTSKGKARQFLLEICKTYGLCPQVMGLEKGSGPCFAYQLKKCEGACAGKQPPEKYNTVLEEAFENQKISQWPFNSPVLIQEVSNESDEITSLVVDKWCLIAQVTQAEHCSPKVSFHSKVFDLDTYKILRSYLNNKRHKLTIKPIVLDSLYEMAGA